MEQLWPADVILTGTHVRLEPLRPDHETDLVDAVKDGELWKIWYTTHIPPPERVGEDIDQRLRLRAAGAMVPFAVIDLSSQRAVGITTYMNIVHEHRRLEIGSTWYRESVQRTAVNSEAKLLLLRHAFETLDCIAVELRTSSFNLQSRTAIERLGARLDGILRSHQILRDDILRDTYVYSITAREWPGVRMNLQAILHQA